MPPERKFSLKKIIVVGVIILIVAFFIGLFITRQQNQDTSSTPTSNNLFPFGTSQNQQSGAGEVPSSDITDSQKPDVITNPDRVALRQITQYPVTDYYPFTQNKIIREPKLDEKTGETVFTERTVATDYLRFNAKENGIISDAELTPDSIVITQKTQTEIPLAEELWFGNSGNSIVFRSWNEITGTIDTLVATLPTRKTTLEICSLPFNNTFQAGSNGSIVTELQKYLAEKLGPQAGVIINGVYGPKTTSFVTQVQKILGVPETGAVDEATKIALNADCAVLKDSYEKQMREPVQLTPSFLPENILRGTVSPDGNSFFFLQKKSTGVVGMLSTATGLNQRNVLNHPLTEWRPQWVATNTITLTTLASADVDGYMYTLTPSGTFKKVLGPLQGLTTNTGPDGVTTLASVSSHDTIQTFLLKTTTGETSPLGLGTLPEKCTWEDSTSLICAVPNTIPESRYPDVWYQGIVSFNDSFWRINTTTLETSLLFTPQQKTDGIQLRVSPGGNYLYFINRINGTLWSFRMS